MSKQPSSYLSSKLEGRLKADKSGNSIFALEPIKKGELIAVFGGVVYEWETFIHLPERERMLCLQVEDRHFLVPRPIGEGDYVNHSCNPNAGLSARLDSLLCETSKSARKFVSIMPCAIPCLTMSSTACAVRPIAAGA